MDFRLGELFSGPGGIGLGALMASQAVAGASISHRWATDYDEDTCATYAANIGGLGSAGSLPVRHSQPHPADGPPVYCADISRLNTELLPQIDALAFGAPCNDHSQVGERRGLEGEYGPLYSYGVAVLHFHRPYWFVFENVGGIRGEALNTVMADFAEAGYRLYPHYYDFSDYRVPQKRKRVIIVGIRSDLEIEYRVPAPVAADVSASSALAGIPADAPNHEYAHTAAQTVERLDHIRPGQNAWTADLPEHLRIRTKTKLSSIYRRLHPDEPAYTVTGSGGGGTHIYHWSEPRALTNRERARLQSFDDEFIFIGGRGSVRRQIGMAVPPVGAAAIFEAVLKSFAGVGYPCVDLNMAHQAAEVAA